MRAEEPGPSVPGEPHAPSRTAWWRRVLVPGMKRALREPLLHFLLIGLALFAVYAYTQRGRSGIDPSREIVVSTDDLRQMDDYFEAQWHRPPTAAELMAMVEDRVQQEVLYREALAMGLDRGDEIVRRRMAQKMKFLSEDVAAAHEPTTAELRAWFVKNSGKFALPGRYSFRHLYFSTDRRGAHAKDDARSALTKIAGQAERSAFAISLGDRFMFEDYYADRAPSELAKEFGPQFAVALESIKPGAWQGPIESGFGWHLVYVDMVSPGRIPSFEEAEADIKTAWLGEQKDQVWKKAYDDMRAKYTVLVPGLPDNGGPR